jgi:uncharacterized protein YoxC
VENLIALAVTTLIGAFVGSFLGAYLKKKGENLATHEDLDKLAEQVRVVTTTTKEIEAKISTEVWDRQKRWELKRDVLFEAIKRLGSLRNALLAIESAYQVYRQRQQRGEPVTMDDKLKAGVNWMDALRDSDETSLLMGVICGKEAKDTCDDYLLFARKIGIGVYSDDLEIYAKSAHELAKKLFAAMSAIRKELETGKTN